ncbi:MAG TPA: hypothetical protein VKA03_05890 [Methylovirgula sp.]|nr:hypothetical protein [Methylovirgula sp.]
MSGADGSPSLARPDGHGRRNRNNRAGPLSRGARLPRTAGFPLFGAAHGR